MPHLPAPGVDPLGSASRADHLPSRPSLSSSLKARARPASSARAGQVPAPRTPRAFVCRCGRPVFFRNSQCLACDTMLGYDAQRCALLPIALEEAGDASGWWRTTDGKGPRYRRCVHLGTASACNWLIDEQDPQGGPGAMCRCCRLLVAVPDLSAPGEDVLFNRIELARRRLVSQLVGLGLPVRSRLGEEPEQGLAFELRRAWPGEPPVTTGHADGTITIDLEEADDATREQRRADLHEPYRTLLGHLRHETGHYYWQRLVQHGSALAPFREQFGDERDDYGAALQTYYADGAPPRWNTTHVSAYACAHPWEDWAETWAHYLHMADTVDTARSFGIDGEHVELSYESFDAATLGDAPPQGTEFLALVRSWMELTGVLNELSRSMGVPDFYPFVLSAPVVRKLHLVHRVVTGDLSWDA